MKIKVSATHRVTDGAGVITEYLWANNLFLGVMVYRPEGYDFAGWASYGTDGDRPIARAGHTEADYSMLVGGMSARSMMVIRDARERGVEVIEPTDEEFYGSDHSFELYR